MIELAQHQIDAIKRMHNGCILRGDVGSGKSRTALAYYYISVCKGMVKVNDKGSLREMESPRDLFIITTAKKRDDESWYDELAPFCITKEAKDNPSGINVTIDSWNNIKKYQNVYGAMFIFDEQRLVGSGAWVKAFYNIARKNQWILLSATPGDTWKDYIPMFVANGYFKNPTDFKRQHAILNPYIRGKIDSYYNTAKLVKYRNEILVNMKDKREAVEHHIEILCKYNKELYRTIKKDRWDPYDKKPIEETGKLCYLERRVSNDDSSRIAEMRNLLEQNLKVIIFYNFDYELETLRELCDNMCIRYNEWNGHKHEPVPDEGNLEWAYLVQYAAGCEAWNCITTNVIIFYSQNYSYKVMTQSAGRINRMNTPFKDLYYYHLRSYSPIDLAIKRALALKKNFNEKSYLSS